MDTKRFFYGGPRKSKNFKEIMEILDDLIKKEIEIKEYETEFPEFHKNTEKYSFLLIRIIDEKIIKSFNNKLIKKDEELFWQDENGSEIPKSSVVAWEKMIAERQVYRNQAKEKEEFETTRRRMNKIFNSSDDEEQNW